MTAITDPPPLVKRRRWRRLLLLAVPLALLIGVWTCFYFASDLRWRGRWPRRTASTRTGAWMTSRPNAPSSPTRRTAP